MSLYRDRWTFHPARGVLIRKKDKKGLRPLVVFLVSDRIVQRAILEVLKEDENVRPFFEVETSFGGIEGTDRGVEQAVKKVQTVIRAGTQHFIKTDIKDFFRGIRPDVVVQKIAGVVPDRQFVQLLGEAVHTELANMAELGELGLLFPTEDVGVAQGCCLSPVVGNIYLEEFDKKMNGRGITCLRYMDDFLLLGPTEKKVWQAFESARKFLQDLGLGVFDPNLHPDKAQAGKTGRAGISFLGCEIYPNQVYPNKASRDRVIQKVKARLDGSIKAMSTPENVRKDRMSLSETLQYVDNVLKAWANSYTFCNHTVLFRQLDEKIDELLAYYMERYRIAKGRIKKDIKKANRRILGIHVLQDTAFLESRKQSKNKQRVRS